MLFKRIIKKKKAFSMIELLFVMIILAAITGIAINNNSDTGEAARISALKSDLKGAMQTLNAFPLTVPENLQGTWFRTSIKNPYRYGGIDPTEVSEEGIGYYQGQEFHLSKDNGIYISGRKCVNSTGGEYLGYYAITYNESTSKAAYINTCVNGKIQLMDKPECYFYSDPNGGV